jgi:trehalose 6-phosphate synthase/phosphatase
MNRLFEVKQMQQSMYAKRISNATRQSIKMLYSNTRRRIIFLDYDGTLVGFKTSVELASPDEELIRLLKELSSDQETRLVIVSGRAPRNLDIWLGSLDIDIISEHGAWTKTRHNSWMSVPGLNSQWKKEIYPVLEAFTDRTPGAFIEEKDFSLVWHYRKVEESLGELRTNELMNTLRYLLEDKGLQVLPGNKVVEIKNIEINKGKAVMSFVQDGDYDFIMAIGDDYTDEDIFKALPSSSITIKVGSHVSAARYYIGDYQDVRGFLQDLSSYNNKSKDIPALNIKEK